MLRIYIDGDACPVKAEVYRVALRYELPVTVVANSRIHVPTGDWIQLIVVTDDMDAADDWIAQHAADGDIVVTNDIPLAGRCVENGARVLTPKGRVYTVHNIGDALAERELVNQLRELGTIGGGPAPFGKNDRSTFLQRLDEMVNAIKREKR